MEISQLEFMKHLLRRKRRVYLDHNATTSVSRGVRRAMDRTLRNCYGNPSSLYALGRQAAAALELARARVAAAVGATPEEIIFTGCATESNNTVLKSLTEHFYPKKKQIIATPIEHPSIHNTLHYLESRGTTVAYCPVDRQGRVDLQALDKQLDRKTFLVCCMLANNELGTIQDLRAISELAHHRGALVLADCVQALGKIPIDLPALDVDYASFSAHKLHGPKGVGALYVKPGSPLKPWLHGGHQEEGLRAGTESLHNIVGFGVAAHGVDRLLGRSRRILALKQGCMARLKQIHPKCVFNSPQHDCLPNTINVTFPGYSNRELMAMLDYHGIAVSAGSACSSSEDKPSHVLTAIGLPDEQARQTIRISLGHDTSAGDIRYFLRRLRKFLHGQAVHVSMLTVAELDKQMLDDEETWLLDVRPRSLRQRFPSLPHAHEAPWSEIHNYLDLIPRDKHIIVVCQGGYLSFMIAWYLKAKGWPRVSNLLSGIAGWIKQHKAMYQEVAGKNVQVLTKK